MESVYLLSFWTRIKIWRSKKPLVRKNNIEQQSWILSCNFYYIPVENAVEIENKMHRIFSWNRTVWEYFEWLDFDFLKRKLNFICKWVDLIDLMNKEEKIIYKIKEKIWFNKSNNFFCTVYEKWKTKEVLWSKDSFKIKGNNLYILTKKWFITFDDHLKNNKQRIIWCF